MDIRKAPTKRLEDYLSKKFPSSTPQINEKVEVNINDEIELERFFGFMKKI